MVYKIETKYNDEGYFECLLQDGSKIDVSFDMFFEQVKKDEPELFDAINKYSTYEEGIEFLAWMGIDITKFLNNYLKQLIIDNGGHINDLVWVKNEEGEWDLNPIV